MTRNRICQLLGIRYPIIQAPMNWVSGADLAAAVESTGGLGTIGPNAREAVVKAEDACTVSLHKDVMLARDLSNTFTRKYLEMKAAGAPSEELHTFLNEHSQYQAQRLGDAEDAEICCGQVAGLITDVPTAGEVIDGIVKRMKSLLEEVHQKVTDFL